MTSKSLYLQAHGLKCNSTCNVMRIFHLHFTWNTQISRISVVNLCISNSCRFRLITNEVFYWKTNKARNLNTKNVKSTNHNTPWPIREASSDCQPHNPQFCWIVITPMRKILNSLQVWNFIVICLHLFFWCPAFHKFNLNICSYHHYIKTHFICKKLFISEKGTMKNNYGQR